MKRLFLLLVALACGACFADAPAWLKKPDKEFPAARYLRAEGEGRTAKQAQAQAVSTLSLYFDTKTAVVVAAAKQSAAVLAGDSTQYASAASVRQVTQIASAADFFCVGFTEAWKDEKRGVYQVLAYIDKQDAAAIYRSRIQALMQGVAAYRSYAQGESEPFLAATALHKAQVLAALAERYIKAETTLAPADTAKFQSDLQLCALIPAERAALKKQLSFSIIMNQQDERYQPLATAVAAIVERYGYSCALTGAAYRIVIDVTGTEESNSAGLFVRPSANVLVLNAGGSGVYTYSKAYPRTGGKTLEQAYTRAVSKIQQDLEEHFLAE